MDITHLFESVRSAFYEHKDTGNIEFEFRLGKLNCGTFDTDIGKADFDFIMDGLRRYDGWERVISTNEEVFYREHDNLRISIDMNSGDEKVIHKERLHKQDFNEITNSPYDVRFSVSKEIPIDNYEGEMDKKKTKYRLSFIRKNLSIDMTVVSGDVDDMDTEDPNRYQVEFEIIDPSLVKDDNQLFNIVHKIRDVFNMFSSINR